MTTDSGNAPSADEPVTDPAPSDGPPPRPPVRRLTRSTEDRVIGGVSGGLGEYFGIDPVLIRIAWVVLVVFAGTGVLLYLLAWIIVPEAAPSTRPVPSTRARGGSSGGPGGALVLALILIGAGVLALLRSTGVGIDLDFLSWSAILAVALGVVGLGLLLQARQGLNGGLVTVGVVLTVILASLSSVDIDIAPLSFDGAFGERDEAPRTAATLEDEYGHAFGSFTLDLGDFDLSTLPPGTTRIEVDTGFGSVEIRHGGLPVRVESSAVFGDSEDFESADYQGAERRILIELNTAFGSSSVRR